MMLGRWSTEWPTEEGFYWYYGFPFDNVGEIGKIELTVAKIYKEEGVDCLLCILFGTTIPLYLHEPNDMAGRPFGVFFHKKINHPTRPKVDFFEKTLKEKNLLFNKKECKGKEFELRKAKKEVQELEQWLARRKEIDKVTSGGYRI